MVVGIRDRHTPNNGAALRINSLVTALKRNHHVDYQNLGILDDWHAQSLVWRIGKSFKIFSKPWQPAYSTINEQSFKLPTGYDLVIASEIWTHPYWKECRKAPRFIIDLHNVDSISEAQAGMHSYWTAQLRRQEKKASQMADDIWIPSTEDAKLFKTIMKRTPKVVPNVIDGTHVFPPLNKEKIIGFVGSFNYSPNEEAAIELMLNILPELPDYKLKLIGRNPTKTMKSIAQGNSNIIITGSVEQIQPHLATIRYMVLPIRSGGGTRLKVLEAWKHGIPVIASAKAVEGLDARSPYNFLHAETSSQFRHAIETLDNLPHYALTMQAASAMHLWWNYSIQNLELPL